MGDRGKCKTILVIEDDEGISETLKEIFQLEGYTVETAFNGQEALEMLKIIERPCLILLDMFMPVMNGWQFLEELKLTNGEGLTSIPIVITSAAGDQAKEASKKVRGYIKKPADINVLLDTAKKFCSNG